MATIAGYWGSTDVIYALAVETGNFSYLAKGRTRVRVVSPDSSAQRRDETRGNGTVCATPPMSTIPSWRRP